MKMNNRIRWSLAVAALLPVAMFAGCAGEEAPSAEVVAEHADAAVDHAQDAAGHAGEAMQDAAGYAGEAMQDAVAAFEATPAVNAVLAKADLADGTEDHVVGKCPGCSLAMEGTADHPMTVGDYSLHFCSDECRDRFTESGAQAILDLPVEAKEGAASAG